MAVSLEQINGQGNLPVDFNMEIPNAVDQGKILINTRAIEFLMRLTGIGILHIGTYEDEKKPVLQPSNVEEVTSAVATDVITKSYEIDNGDYLPEVTDNLAAKWSESIILLNKSRVFDMARVSGVTSLDPKLWVDLIDHGVRNGLLELGRSNIANFGSMTKDDLYGLLTCSLSTTVVNFMITNNLDKLFGEGLRGVALTELFHLILAIPMSSIINYFNYRVELDETLIKKKALHGYRFSLFNSLPQFDRYSLAQIYGRTNTLAAVKE